MAEETLDEFLQVLRKFRDDYAERFNYDIEAICRDIRERGRESGREYISSPPEQIAPTVDVPLVDQVESTISTDTSPTVSRGS